MLRILIVDDDRNMRELLSLHLKHAGYEIQSAEDGIAAGYAVLYQRPDLIICDVIMPHMNGLEFVAALRADPVQQNIPVIFLTTAADAETRGRELGAVGFLRKPVRADALLSFIAEKVQGGLVPLR